MGSVIADRGENVKRYMAATQCAYEIAWAFVLLRPLWEDWKKEPRWPALVILSYFHYG